MKELLLSEEEARVAHRVLLAVGQADGALDPEELALVDAFASHWFGSGAASAKTDGLEVEPLADLLGAMTRGKALYILRHAEAVAAADGFLAEAERRILEEFATPLAAEGRAAALVAWFGRRRELEEELGGLLLPSAFATLSREGRLEALRAIESSPAFAERAKAEGRVAALLALLDESEAGGFETLTGKPWPGLRAVGKEVPSWS